MITIGITILFFLALLSMHEFGHYVSAKIMGIEISKIGFSKYPVFHPYIEVINIPDNIVKYIFLYSGPCVTIILFSTSLLLNLLNYSPLYYAFILLMIVEYNPYHSDFTISFNIEPNSGFKERSAFWYCYFLLWVAFIFFCFAPNGLRQIVNSIGSYG